MNVIFPVTADTFLVEGNKQEYQLSQLIPSTTYSVALYATKGPLTSGTVIANFVTRKCSITVPYVLITGGLRRSIPPSSSYTPLVISKQA